MMNEEMYLKSRMGDKNPFRVPEGNFDSFTAEMMQKLPEQQERSRVIRFRPWLYAAACLFVALLTTAIYFVTPETNSQQMATTTIQDSYVDDIDDAADYVMADNMDIYACLANDF